MKRYETMSREEIMNALTEWFDNGCGKRILKYLTEEMPAKKVVRVSMLKTADDLKNERRKFEQMCKKNEDCNACPYDDRNRLPKGCDFASCWDIYLAEEIEVEE